MTTEILNDLHLTRIIKENMKPPKVPDEQDRRRRVRLHLGDVESFGLSQGDLEKPLYELDWPADPLTARTAGRMSRLKGIDTVRQALSTKVEEYSTIPSFGEKSLGRLIQVLTNAGYIPRT